jgi:hypothetical protein
MKRAYMTALVAVFLSLTITGCYTKLKGPEPGTGVENNSYNEYPYYYDNYYNPLFFQNGWYSPYYFGSPSYFGNFYYPWWYDPYYYNDGTYGGDHFGGNKAIRGRGVNGDLPPIPSGGYVAPSPPSPPSGQSQPPSTSSPSKPNGNQGSSGDNGNSGGKATRGR